MLGMRTVAIAYKDLKKNEGGSDHREISQDSDIYTIERHNLTLVAILGIAKIID
jgi:hypothetical protein